MENMSLDNDWIDTKEAMELTGYAQEYIRQLARADKIKAKKFFGKILVSKSSLMEYYEKQSAKR